MIFFHRHVSPNKITLLHIVQKHLLNKMFISDEGAKRYFKIVGAKGSISDSCSLQTLPRELI